MEEETATQFHCLGKVYMGLRFSLADSNISLGYSVNYCLQETQASVYLVSRRLILKIRGTFKKASDV